MEKEIPIRKEIDVTFVILRKNGVSIATASEISEQLKKLRERFAQVGVKVNVAPLVYANIEDMSSTGVSVPFASDSSGEYDGIFEIGRLNDPSADELLLFNSYGTPDDTSDIRIFYVEEIDVASGLAYTDEVASDYGEPGFKNNIVISKVATMRSVLPKVFTLPHEVVHILLGGGLPNKGHILNDDTNLMSPGTSTGNYFSATKRLNLDQESKILSNKDL